MLIFISIFGITSLVYWGIVPLGGASQLQVTQILYCFMFFSISFSFISLILLSFSDVSASSKDYANPSKQAKLKTKSKNKVNEVDEIDTLKMSLEKINKMHADGIIDDAEKKDLRKKVLDSSM